MKKRRILALLLALSLSVNVNGMTVLAASSDAADYSAAAGMDDIAADTGENAEDVQQVEESGEEDQTDNPSGTGAENSGTGSEAASPDDAEDAKGDSVPEDGSDNQDNIDNPTQDEEQGKGEKPSEDENGKGDETGAEEENPGAGEMPDDGTIEDVNPDDTEQTEDSENPGSADEKNSEGSETDESISGNTIGLPKMAGKSVRMVTFTDDTGMMVTYNANEEYNLTINEGVLNGITIADGTPEGKAVTGVVAVPEGKGITAIGAAFQGNKDITYVKLPSGVTAVGNSAFSDCSNLKGVYLPNGVKTIGDSAFESCTQLLKIAIPKQVESIGSRAFYQDSSLFMVYMQDADYSNLVSIGDQAFYQCRKLMYFASDSEFVLPTELESIGASAFYGCTAITEIDLHEQVKQLGESVFEGCTGLESVVLSSSLAEIPARAFAGCNKIQKLQFKEGNQTIGEAAFDGCSQLGQVDFVGSIANIGNNAFRNCGSLASVIIHHTQVAIGVDAFPIDLNPALIVIGDSGSNAEKYALENNLKFVELLHASGQDKYYTYIARALGVSGGKVLVKDAEGNDPNKANGNKGVPYGTELFVSLEYGGGIALRTDSVKCNGVVLKKTSSGAYSFKMPVGGAYITAEFVNQADSQIQATDNQIKINVSNGEATIDKDGNVSFLQLKVGQNSRVFLTDASDDNRAVSASKVTYKSDDPAIVSIKANGTIQALKAGKTTTIRATVKSETGEIRRSFPVSVIEAGIDTIKIKAIEWDAKSVKPEETASGIKSVSIGSYAVRDSALSFKLRATAYDKAEDKVTASLSWTSSDSKVAKLSAASTGVNSTDNTITIPKGANGEATIRVSAKTDKNTTITQKFVIRITDTTPRLAQKSITINPNYEEGARLQIISAYGGSISTSTVKLKVKNGENDFDDFGGLEVTYLPAESDSTKSTFELMPRLGLNDGTYSLVVDVGNNNKLPLTVIVKTSKPNPKLAFEKKQPKKNLFYADDGTEFIVNISNLGKVKVAEYTLEPLNEDNEDDLKFKKNFEVEKTDGDTCVIRQANDNLECAASGTNKGKPVVTGYLQLHYEGFKEDGKHTLCQKLKITLPTQRTAPAWKLNRTTDTFKVGCGEQTIELQLVDKKNLPADMKDGGYSIYVYSDEISSPVEEIRNTIAVDEEGKFTLTLRDGASKTGKVRLRLENESLWATKGTDKEKIEFVYTVKMVNTAPKISLTDGPLSTTALKSSTVTINPKYPEQTAVFGMMSNQKGTAIEEQQQFTQKPTNNKNLQAQYDKLRVEYEGGIGSVTVTESDIKDGTYTYTCTVQYSEGSVSVPANKVTLKVKIKQAVPTVTVKGSMSLNSGILAGDTGYAEQGEVSLVTKNLPEGYEFDSACLDTIKCTTKNKGQYAEFFDWNLLERQIGEDGKVTEARLTASLKQFCPAGTYRFSFTPSFTGVGDPLNSKSVSFTIKVYNAEPGVSLAAKGKLNLLDRTGTLSATNSIIYTPTLKNIKDKVIEAKVFDYNSKIGWPSYDGDESDYFEASVLSDGKIYVRPIEDAKLENNVVYQVCVWVELENYKGGEFGGGLFYGKPLSIKTAQTLPKVTTDKSAVELYLSNKNYVATFTVDKKDAKAIGKIESITFGEKDTNAQESFVTTKDENGKETVIESEQQEDGSLKVSLKLRDTVLYSCDSTNKLTMYVRFEGQGTNTAGTAITMNVKINK